MTVWTTRIIKLLGAALVYPIMEAWRILAKLIGEPFSGFAVAIYYHRVPAEYAQRFACQMDHLVRWGEPIRADRSDPPSRGSRSVMVTFDDGWHTFYTNALPEITQRKIPVTVFPIVERLGEPLERDIDERLMTKDELLRLPADSVTIGSHTCTHAKLPMLDEQDVRRELRDSREALKDLTKRDVKLFCFPHGVSSPDTIRWCAEEGYTRAFTGVRSLAIRRGDEFAVGRIIAEPTDWPIEFHLKISGAYCWVPVAIAAKRALRSTLRSISPANGSSRNDQRTA